MFKRKARLFLMGVLAMGFQAFVAGTASAHTLTVTASESCATGIPIISYTATSYDTSTFHGSNPTIEILFNGSVVDTQPFILAKGNQFSGSMPAPLATTTVDVEAFAAGTWIDGFAGGESSNTVIITITDCPPGTGRFTGGGKQVLVDPLTITKGFEVDCDRHQPSNNLEINWKDAAGAHQFHLENFTSAKCTLVPPAPNPPKAPVNTIVGVGTGRYDGVDGYNVIFTLEDHGEPGAGVDEAGFEIFSGSPVLNPGTPFPVVCGANPNDVLCFPLSFITDGNIQAHVDQK